MRLPTTKKKFQNSKAPEIDWLWAAYLERQKVYGIDLKEMSKIAGVSYGTMRQYQRVSPWEWPVFVRERIFEKLGVRIIPTMNGLMEVKTE